LGKFCGGKAPPGEVLLIKNQAEGLSKGEKRVGKVNPVIWKSFNCV
jgi:hypothetical protein